MVLNKFWLAPCILCAETVTLHRSSWAKPVIDATKNDNIKMKVYFMPVKNNGFRLKQIKKKEIQIKIEMILSTISTATSFLLFNSKFC
jgi:hypothetical protein